MQLQTTEKRVLRPGVGLNVSKEQILSNIETNINNPQIPWLTTALANIPSKLCIVGGGPSLANSIVDIVLLKRSGAKVMALNGAHDYLIGSGIIPDYFLMIDARPDNTIFLLNPHEDVLYLLASQCHPDCFDALDGYDVRLWHTGASHEAQQITKAASRAKGFPDFIEVGGGCTVGLRALFFAYANNFREMHLFGYDSSYVSPKEHHAYSQPLNDQTDKITVEVDGKSFLTSPTMAKQAYQFQGHATQLITNGCEIFVYGGGLLPEVAKVASREILQSDLEGLERRKYSQIWSFDVYRTSSPGEELLDDFGAHFDLSKPRQIIDFGCGPGRATQKLKDQGHSVLGVDIAPNCLDDDVDVPLFLSTLWNLPDSLHCEVGYCCDVMEHIPSEKVDEVLANISRCCSEGVFFQIAFTNDQYGMLIYENLHLTVQPKEWWLDKLNEYFSDVTYVPSQSSWRGVFIAKNTGDTEH